MPHHLFRDGRFVRCCGVPTDREETVIVKRFAGVTRKIAVWVLSALSISGAYLMDQTYRESDDNTPFPASVSQSFEPPLASTDADPIFIVPHLHCPLPREALSEFPCIVYCC